jgi:ADP-ribosylglycohydrolase
MRKFPFILLLSFALMQVQGKEKSRIIINEQEFYDKVYACWLGKSIGGTLGMPYEGQRETHNLTFYQPIPKEPVPNDDLDLQLLWLKALEENGPNINAHTLAQYWLKYVVVDWNEYGIGKNNIKKGILPPLSGHFNNPWRDSNGAWIRSEIWACLFPRVPSLAAKYAFEDACVDHGVAEGTYAEVFMAVLESAAFVIKDRDELLKIAFSYIPKDCGVAESVRTAIRAWREGLDWRTARERVVEASRKTGWFMAPQNVAFVILGWLYGAGDFGKSICTAVNCGDDTDCTGATLGSLLGILNGTKGIPKEWREPISENIVNVAIGGFQPPKTIRELTERVVKMAKISLKYHKAPVEISSSPTNLKSLKELKMVDEKVIKNLWSRSPYKIELSSHKLQATIDYREEPWLEAGKEKNITLTLRNLSGGREKVKVICEMEKGVRVSPSSILAQLPTELKISLRAEEVRKEEIRGRISVFSLKGELLGEFPLAFVGRISVNKDDFALAKYGVTATSDSELDWEKGCTSKVNDGIIAGENDFEGKRWHSALTTHPHWVALHLPKERELGRVIIHFADPKGHPVDFDGEVSLDGKEWKTIFTVKGYENDRKFEYKLNKPILIKHFRLMIYKSASEIWKDAAQVSEIELLPD